MLPTTKPDSKTAHTQGPWQCSPYNKADSLYAVYDADGNELTYDDYEHEANARLIAAAPDMFEALRDVVTFTSFYKGKMEDTLGDEALAALGETAIAAIAKAEGGAQ